MGIVEEGIAIQGLAAICPNTVCGVFDTFFKCHTNLQWLSKGEAFPVAQWLKTPPAMQRPGV